MNVLEFREFILNNSPNDLGYLFNFELYLVQLAIEPNAYVDLSCLSIIYMFMIGKLFSRYFLSNLDTCKYHMIKPFRFLDFWYDMLKVSKIIWKYLGGGCTRLTHLWKFMQIMRKYEIFFTKASKLEVSIVLLITCGISSHPYF